MKYLIINILLLASFHCSAQKLTHHINGPKQNKIIVYGSDSCHSCLDTKAFLKEKNIKFTYYDIDINKSKEQEMLVKLQKAKISTHTISLPVIDYKGDVFLNKGNLKKLLKILDTKISGNEN